MPPPQPQPARVPTPRRPPWWIPVVRIFGAASFFGGIASLLAIGRPGPHPRALVLGIALTFGGVALFPVAWMKCARRPSPPPAEERAQEADNQPIPPREA